MFTALGADSDLDLERQTEPDVYSDIKDGMCYKEVATEVNAQCKDSLLLSFILNTDGVSLFEKPQRSFWPVFLYINELKPSRRCAPFRYYD